MWAESEDLLDFRNFLDLDLRLFDLFKLELDIGLSERMSRISYLELFLENFVKAGFALTT